MIVAAWKPKTTIFTMVFSSGNKNHVIYHVSLPGPSKNTGIYAVFSVLQDVVSIYGKHKSTVFYVVFASRAQKKESTNCSKTDVEAPMSGHHDPS